jgi:tetratricopeptide (TPR) repeat protein
MTSSTSANVPDVELSVQRAHEFMRVGNYTQALSSCEELATRVPENRDLLYCIAVSQRHLQRTSAALDTLERLERHHPFFSRLHQERGHCYVSLRDAPRAIDSFLKAVHINPALPASWKMLEGLYVLGGDAQNAATAGSHIETLRRLPVEIVQATALFSDGDLALAERIVRAYLHTHGDDIEALRLLARIAFRRDVLDDAQVLLESVLRVAPDYRAARHDYALVLLERHRYLQAREQLEKLLQVDPLNRDFRTLYATASVGLGEHEKAAQLYRELLRDAPQAAELHLSLAHALKTLGQRDESIVAYRSAAAARPNFGDAYWSLANLKTYRFADDELARMRAEESESSTSTVDRYHLCFALGKAYEDRGDYSLSWMYYERGNALKRAESRYRPELIEANTRLQKEICTREFLNARANPGAPQTDPIFILGLPRSGSTLIEQILASHSMVEGTQELADIPRLVLELQGAEPDLDHPRYPGVLRDLPEEAFREFGERYLRDTRVHRSGKPFFIDKMPNNFRHIGLIHLILPNARIIDARREPMACCFSNFKQLFATGQEFTYSIEDIARYYRSYLELMSHWDDVLPGRILRVQHEDVVDDLEGNVRRILEFCALPFEPACVEFHKTTRSVRTASSEQVRQPIFREGLYQWRNYESQLGPLVTALGDALVRY